MLKAIGIFIFVIFIIGSIFDGDNDKPLKSETKVKYEQRTSEHWLSLSTRDVKNCVKTLGDGVYKDKGLYQKLEMCNANDDNRWRVVTK